MGGDVITLASFFKALPYRVKSVDQKLLRCMYNFKIYLRTLQREVLSNHFILHPQRYNVQTLTHL